MAAPYSKVLIIGGGIGGLTAAVALRQRGIEAVVYEAAPELQPVGKGIWVPTNAMLVLQRLGLSDAVGEAGWTLERIQLRSATDGLLQDFDLRKVVERFGQSTVSIHRAALVNVLAGGLPTGTLHLGKRFVSFQQDDRVATAHFSDGTQDRGDVLIGADGIRSSVREQLFPGVPLRYSGQTCFRGIADLEPPKEIARTCWEIWGGELRVGLSPVGPRQIYWFAPMLAPADSPTPTGSLADWLATRYAGFPDPVPETLRHTPSADIVRTDLYDFVPIDRWCQGRVVLLGDAAHATTPNLGQGGAQAIEDAYVLAQQLAQSSRPIEAFQAYESLRMPKAKWVVNTAWKFGRVAHVRNRLVQKLRNWSMKLTSESSNQRRLDRLYTLNY
jgi:2-polyprenyl-6-methoxyphenol hydroxylase-like FAD-dependent oxidoreductase